MARVNCPVCGSEFELANHDAMVIGEFHDCTNNVIGTLIPAKVGTGNQGLMAKANAVQKKYEALKASGAFTEEEIAKMIGVVGYDTSAPIVEDDITKQIFENRAAMNKLSFRPKITAQFIKMHFGHKGGVHEAIQGMSYNYQFEMLEEEVRQIYKMQKDGNEEWKIRSEIFKLDMIKGVIEQYTEDVKTFFLDKVDNDPIRRCKGSEYIKYWGLKSPQFFKNCCFSTDVWSKIIYPMNSLYYNVKRASSYEEMYSALKTFNYSHIVLPVTTSKNNEWIDAYKKAGSFYSMINLSQFQKANLVVRDYKTKKILNKYEARCYLIEMVHKNTGYEMYGQFKQMLKDNNFTLEAFNKLCEETKAARLSK